MVGMQNKKQEPICPYCANAMHTTRMSCGRCNVSVEAEFADSPVARLPVEHQRFIEMFVLAGGSLKEIAAQAGVSYPTVRNRLDKVIEQLRQELSPGQAPKNSEEEAANAADILKRI